MTGIMLHSTRTASLQISAASRLEIKHFYLALFDKSLNRTSSSGLYLSFQVEKIPAQDNFRSQACQ